MQIYDELVARGLIAQVTDEKEIRDLVNNGKATFYIGFDPTADSLHVGQFYGFVPDEAPADGRKSPRGFDWRRHRLCGRPQRPHRYAQHDDPRNDPAQL